MALISLGALGLGFSWWSGRHASLRHLLVRAGLTRPNVLLVTLDTTRADHLSPYGNQRIDTPVFERLAREGVLFEQCITPTAYTLPSHASIMTGSYPMTHGVRLNGNNALSPAAATLAETFAEHGYMTGAFIGAFVLDGRWGLAQGFARYDDHFSLEDFAQVDLASVQRPANEVVDASLKWLDEVKDKPFFSWVHLYDPHTPYEPPEYLRQRYVARGLEGLYDGEIAFVDEQVGRLLRWLDERSLTDRTIVVVVGDHGEGLGSHGEMTHGYFIYDYAVRVPLIVRLPVEAAAGRRVAAQVRTIDILPTLLELAGVPGVAGVDGQSLLPLCSGGREDDRDAYAESMAPNLQYGWAALYSFRAGRYKYIDAPKPELYDLRADPGELRNLFSEQPARAEALAAALSRLRETPAGAPAAEPANIDQETLMRLASLGYIGGVVTARNGADLPDPKDTLPVYREIAAAAELISRADFAAAARSLERVLAGQPLLPQANLLLATCLAKLDRRAEAKQQLDAVLKDNPSSVQALVNLANILVEEGKGADVMAVCQHALAIDEQNPQAHTLIGQVHMEAGEFDQALSHVRRAAEIQPKLTRNRQNLAACLIGLGQLTQAERILDDLVARHAEFPQLQFHRGLLLEQQGRLAEARRAYELEVAAHPRTLPAQFNLGLLELKMGNREAYIERMESIVAIAPEAPKGYLLLARGLLAAGADLDRAEHLIHRGLGLARNAELQALGHFLLADLYNRQGAQGRAQQALERARAYQAKLSGRPRVASISGT